MKPMIKTKADFLAQKRPKLKRNIIKKKREKIFD
jgi:hypothetical protein